MWVIVDLITREKLSAPIENKADAQAFADYENERMGDNLYCEVVENW